MVDEEHETAYKQEDSPRYHARDAAVMRARLEGVPVVLGSATPSVESETNARNGKYRALAMPGRIGKQGLPRVEIVDRRAVLRAGGDLILSPPLREALEARLASARAVAAAAEPPGLRHLPPLPRVRCPGRLPELLGLPHRPRGGRSGRSATTADTTWPRRRRALPAGASTCGSPASEPSGWWKRCARPFRRHASIVSIATRPRAEAPLARTLAAFEAGETDVLVGTQMIAKGHDFPRVTLVGVVDADVGLGLPDFRSAERTFQLLTQVAGRAGRGDVAGEVILQSHLPDHYAIVAACAQDYAAFYEREMEFRRTMGYPPVAALVNLIVRSREPAAGAREAAALGEGPAGAVRVGAIASSVPRTRRSRACGRSTASRSCSRARAPRDARGGAAARS